MSHTKKIRSAVESDAANEDLVRMLDNADRHRPYLYTFAGAQTGTREVEIVTPKTQV